MNRKERRAADAAGRSTARPVVYATKLDRSVAQKIKAFYEGDEDRFDRDLFDLVASEGFDETLDRQVKEFAARLPDLDIPGFKRALIDEASSYIAGSSPNGAHKRDELVFHHASLFAIPVSGPAGMVTDFFDKPSLNDDLVRVIEKHGLVSSFSMIIAIPLLLDIITAALMMPGRLSGLLRLVADYALLGLPISNELMTDFLGLENIAVESRDALSVRILLCVELQPLSEDEDFPLSVLTSDQERMFANWEGVVSDLLPDEISALPPTDILTAAVDLAQTRVELGLLTEARTRGLQGGRKFDRIEIAVVGDAVWVKAFIDGIELGPIDCPSIVALIDLEEFLEYFEGIAGEVIFVDNILDRGRTVS